MGTASSFCSPSSSSLCARSGALTQAISPAGASQRNLDAEDKEGASAGGAAGTPMTPMTPMMPMTMPMSMTPMAALRRSITVHAGVPPMGQEESAEAAQVRVVVCGGRGSDERGGSCMVGCGDAVRSVRIDGDGGDGGDGGHGGGRGIEGWLRMGMETGEADVLAGRGAEEPRQPRGLIRRVRVSLSSQRQQQHCSAQHTIP
eukprot:2886221-Rhodomonas_salina.2